jgi:hypothetical protein
MERQFAQKVMIFREFHQIGGPGWNISKVFVYPYEFNPSQGILRTTRELENDLMVMQSAAFCATSTDAQWDLGDQAKICRHLLDHVWTKDKQCHSEIL